MARCATPTRALLTWRAGDPVRRGLKETYDDWFRRADQVPLMIKQLQGRDFPERRPGVVVG